MKKLMMVLMLASLSLGATAQDGYTPVQKHSVATNSFWSNWFVQANVAGTSFFSDHATVGSGLLKDYRTNLGASLALGKWFTPGLGLRTKLNGVWGRTVYTEDKSANANKYWALSEQVMFNLSNLFCGYSDSRVWNLVPFVGGAVGRNMSYNTYAMGLNVGLLNQWQLSPRLALNLELAWGIYEPDFDGGGQVNGHGLHTKDQMVSAELGLTFRLGRHTFSRVPDVDALQALSQSQIDALNAQLEDEQAENARLRKLLADQKPQVQTVTVKEVMVAPVSVFFNIGKSKIASRKDLQNVRELVAVANDKGATLRVTGYADSQTGSADYNQQLSQRRAEAVAAELQTMGVSADRIEVVAKGGVDTLSPISYNRRAIVEIK